MSESSTEAVKAVSVIVGELVRAAGDDPKAKEAAANVGTAAVTLTKAINNVLLPIAAVNFAFDKARQYFETRFPAEMQAKVANIPSEELREPAASIAGPALQGLAFVTDEDNMREMFLGLLSTAMDNRVLGNAHPAFVEVIKQLHFTEAKLLRSVLAPSVPFPIVQLRAANEGKRGFTVVANHVVNTRSEDGNGPMSEVSNFASMVDNWIRLGLLTVDYSTYVMASGAYDWAEGRPEYVRLRERFATEGRIVTCHRGVLSVTDFGRRFAAAVGLAAEQSSTPL